MNSMPTCTLSSLGLLGILFAAPLFAQPPEAEVWPALQQRGCQAWISGPVVWLKPSDSDLEKQQMFIPKLNAPIREIGWTKSVLDDAVHEIRVSPEPDRWKFSWQTAPAHEPTLKIEFDIPPRLPEQSSASQPRSDGSFMLGAHQARTFGKRLRYEPQPIKNTIGYWTSDEDYAEWGFQVDQPGKYAVAILQGCGKGQGGSQAKLSVRQRDLVIAELSFTTIETGHFQNFRWCHVGNLELTESGLHQLQVKPVVIAKAALCDIRAIHLIKQAEAADLSAAKKGQDGQD